jgi:hypothetical protein
LLTRLTCTELVKPCYAIQEFRVFAILLLLLEP